MAASSPDLLAGDQPIYPRSPPCISRIPACTATLLPNPDHQGATAQAQRKRTMSPKPRSSPPLRQQAVPRRKGVRTQSPRHPQKLAKSFDGSPSGAPHHCLKNSCSQRGVLGPAASASPGNLSKMQILSPLRPTNSKTPA